MIIQDKKIAIIGGGPGGLTLARLLQLKGAAVKVYERDANSRIRVQGGALDLHTESGLAALAAAGLMESFKANYRPGAELVRVTDNQAKIHSDQHNQKRSEKFGAKNQRPEIDRGPLRDILLNSLQHDTVVWDSYVVSIRQVRSQWEISFQNGITAVADILIGADGANSKIRPFVTDIKPFWTGVTMVEGEVKDPQKTAPVINQLLKGGKIFAFGDEQVLIVSSKGDGSLGFTTSCKTPEFWYRNSGIDFQNNKSVLNWFKKEFSAWSSVWWELFENENTVFIARPQYCMPLNQSWQAKENLTILGDAAHWMPPFAGEGVNMAMLDALQLSEALTSQKMKTARQAIANYERRMFKRFTQSGEETLYNTRWMHAPDALNDMLSMFSENKWKRLIFMSRYLFRVMLFPQLRRLFRIPFKQEPLL